MTDRLLLSVGVFQQLARRLLVNGALVFAGARTLISKTFIVAKAVAMAFGADARSRRLALRVAREAAIRSDFTI